MKKIFFLLIIFIGFFEYSVTFSQTNSAIIKDKTKKIEITGNAEIKVFSQ